MRALLCLLPPGSGSIEGCDFHSRAATHPPPPPLRSAEKKGDVFSRHSLRKIKVLERENRGVNFECEGLTLSVSRASFSDSFFRFFFLHFQKREKHRFVFSKRSSPTQLWRFFPWGPCTFKGGELELLQVFPKLPGVLQLAREKEWGDQAPCGAKLRRSRDLVPSWDCPGLCQAPRVQGCTLLDVQR